MTDGMECSLGGVDLLVFLGLYIQLNAVSRIGAVFLLESL